MKTFNLFITEAQGDWDAERIHREQLRQKADDTKASNATKAQGTLTQHGWHLHSHTSGKSIYKHPDKPGHAIEVEHRTGYFLHSVSHSADLATHVAQDSKR